MFPQVFNKHMQIHAVRLRRQPQCSRRIKKRDKKINKTNDKTIRSTTFDVKCVARVISIF